MICLSFDTDHMTAEGIREFIRRYPLPGRATFFQHRRFEELETSNHEVCPHPLINDLNQWQDAIKQITDGMPSRPVGIRSHSCVYSHMIGIGLNSLGYKYASNVDRLFESGLEPYRQPWGIWELPIYYMDSMDFWFLNNWRGLRHLPFDPKVIRTALENDGLYVFDIHPVHVALNSNSPEQYARVKNRILSEGISPFELRSQGRGAGDFFEELCEAMERAGVRSHTCLEALQLLVE